MSRSKSLFCSTESFLCSFQTFMFLVLLLHQTCEAIATNQTHCPPSSCGNIKNIKHPFRLKNDPTTCGDSRYELSCENNITMLTLYSGKYYVKSINYKNYKMRLVDPGIQESDCSSSPHYLLTTHNFTRSDFYDSKSDPYQIDYNSGHGHIIYLNCSKQVKDDPYYVDTAPCRVNSNFKSHLYAFLSTEKEDVPYKESYFNDYFWVGRMKDYCQVKLVVITSDFQSVKDDVPNRRPFSYEEIHGMLLYGFELSWVAGACKDNCGDNQGCYFDPTTSDFQCYAQDLNKCYHPLGYEENKSCDQVSKVPLFMEGILVGFVGGVRQIIEATIGSDSSDIIISSDSSEEDISSKIGTVIGIVTGKYLLPSYVVRFVLGLLVFFVLLIYTCRRRHISMYENIEVFLRGSTLMPIRYSYKEVKKMTTSFRVKLGEGGFGAVYKGKLRSGSFVAVKMLSKLKGNGQDFISEVATIGRIHHTNVVRLIGFCFEGSKRALVYEFMPNGSLDKYIFSRENVVSLTYKQMYDISLGVARGISYLHQGCDIQILHFDIKPHNILLDENFIPKVSDFGLAKLYPNDVSIVTLTAARGTIGYMAPELFYKNIGGVSYKADVYSFGMLLMEMANKRRNLNSHADRSSQFFFPFWIYNQLIEERDIEMDEINSDEMINVKKMFITALWCIQLKPSDRPSMNKVIEMLEGNIENIVMPPKPIFYPNEITEEDLEVNSDEIESYAASGSVSFLDESTTEPLLMNSA